MLPTPSSQMGNVQAVITMDLHTPYTSDNISQFHYLARNSQGTSISAMKGKAYKPVSLSASPMLMTSGCERGIEDVTLIASSKGRPITAPTILERNCLVPDGYFCCHPGWEMRSRDIRCDGWATSLAHSWPTSPRRCAGAKDEFTHILPGQKPYSTWQGEEEKPCPWRTWHFLPGGREASGGRPCYCWQASLLSEGWAGGNWTLGGKW